MSEAALRATGLLQPGSLVRWRYRVRLAEGAGDADIRRVTEAAASQMPDAGWDIRSRLNATPQLERNIERFTQYLTLVGLTALLVGGVGVANSAKHYLDRKRNVIATLKAVGATGTRVFAIYFTEIMVLAAVGVAIGLVLGAALPFGIAAVLGADPAVAVHAGAASGRARCRGRLRPAHRRRLCAVAARPRPRRAGLGAVSRRDRARAAVPARPLRGRRGARRRRAHRRSRSRPPTTARSRRSSSSRPRWCFSRCGWSRWR